MNSLTVNGAQTFNHHCLKQLEITLYISSSSLIQSSSPITIPQTHWNFPSMRFSPSLQLYHSSLTRIKRKTHINDIQPTNYCDRRRMSNYQRKEGDKSIPLDFSAFSSSSCSTLSRESHRSKGRLFFCFSWFFRILLHFCSMNAKKPYP